MHCSSQVTADLILIKEDHTLQMLRPCPMQNTAEKKIMLLDSHTADVETMSPSGHLDLQLDPDDTMILPFAVNRRENESEVRPGSSCTNHEPMSSSDHLLLTSELQSSEMAQQFDCDSSSEGSVSGVDSEIPDLPEDDPFRQIGFDTDMDLVLMSAGTTTKAEALLMVMSHAARHNITGTQLDDLLKLINTLFGKEVIKYLFNKVFKNNSDIVEFLFYCKTCKVYIGTQEDIDKNIAQCAICSAPIEISSLNSAFLSTYQLHLKSRQCLKILRFKTA
ncbi:uncharacterized protein LOC123979704 isoform X2 [Micropterus dolomieu]|uniref:uncharacterized protein LOC123979704 isoform X2 n=1 Tax=Micropterus dolomieu TaxID=147949 RepID=UPI001E8D0ED2|nr:uncharacterized protein LOC123979704 isoform X2 [Micropterus dolomieu]XP_045919675.1 uncharacterized protein LOC123979704 isoform X2 [Micropterus dolomieu]